MGKRVLSLRNFERTHYFKITQIDKLKVYSSPDNFESSLHDLGFMTRGERMIFELRPYLKDIKDKFLKEDSVHRNSTKIINVWSFTLS